MNEQTLSVIEWLKGIYELEAEQGISWYGESFEDSEKVDLKEVNEFFREMYCADFSDCITLEQMFREFGEWVDENIND